MSKNILKCLLLLLLVNALLIARPVCVGIYWAPGQAMKQDGVLTGVTIDVLNRLATTENWQLEYKEYSFQGALQALVDKEVDVVGGVPFDAAFERNVEYTHIPMGVRRCYLFARKDLTFKGNSYSRWPGLKIAVPSDYVSDKMLQDFMKEHHCKCEVERFTTLEEALKAYGDGRCNAILGTFLPELSQEQILAEMSVVPLYLCFSTEAAALRERAERLLSDWQANDSDYFTKTNNRYFAPVQHRPVIFSEDEQRLLEYWRSPSNALRVDISPVIPPLKMWDKDTSQASGMAMFMLEKLTERYGIAFSVLEPGDIDKAHERLKSGEADIWVNFSLEPMSEKSDEYIPTSISFPTVLVYKIDKDEVPLKQSRISVCRNYPGFIKDCEAFFGKEHVYICDTVNDCYNALVDGRVDYHIAPLHVAGYEIRHHGWENQLQYRMFNSMSFPSLSFSLGAEVSPLGTSILKKCLNNFSANDIQEMLYRSIVDTRPTTFMNKEQVIAIFGIIVILLLLVAMFSFYYQQVQLKRERDAALTAEKAKSFFFSMVSHDIRTPLNAIIGFSELLRLGVDNEETQKKYLDNIVSSGNTLMQLINDVLDLAKLEADKIRIYREFCNCSKLLDNILAPFAARAQEQNLYLKTEIPTELPLLELDPQRVRQILNNLLSNALKYTQQGGVILKVGFQRKTLDNGELTFSVQDSGIGIGRENLHKLMRPFVQLDSQNISGGTGLGLTICKQLLSRMRGDLKVTSAIGKGSTFTLVLHDIRFRESKGSPSGGTTTQVMVYEGETAWNNLSVLLVDDSPVNLKVLEAMCHRLGIQRIDMAANGIEAMEKLNNQHIDLVLTDIWMPKMDGEKLVRAIRTAKRFAEMPVYAVTADVDKQKTFAEQGFSGILLKPMTMEKLTNLLKGLKKPARQN